MRKPFQFGAGSWWRYTAYEIRSGYIRPRRGSTLQEYDPWGQRKDGKQGRERWEAPYQTLINLVRRAARYEDGEWRFSPYRTWEQDLLDWCSRYGLLGLLLASTQSVILAPRWRPAQSFRASEQGLEMVQVLTPQAVRYNRINGGWLDQIYGLLPGPHSLQQPYSKKLLGQPVPKRLWPSDVPRPSAFLEPITGFPGFWHEEPLSKTWARFFPRVPKNKREIYAYPMPGTREFWGGYAEPVKSFWAKGMELAKIHEDLFKAKLQGDETRGAKDDFYAAFCRLRELFARTGTRDIEADKTDFEFIGSRLKGENHSVMSKLYLAICWINNLLASARPTLVFHEDGFHQRWQAESLLGALSMMMLQDLTGEAIVKQCQVDGTFFTVRSEHWAIYCSEKCKEVAKKRAKRSKGKIKSGE